MNGFRKHVAGLRVRGVVGRSLRLLRALAVSAGGLSGCGRTLGAFRLLAGRLRRAAGGRGRDHALRRRFLPVLDSFVEARRQELGLTHEEALLLHRAWLDHIDGGDPREAAGLLLASFRHRRRQGGGSGIRPGGGDAVRLWQSRMAALLLEEFPSATVATDLSGGVVADPGERAASPARAVAWHRHCGRGPPCARLAHDPAKPGGRVSPGRPCRPMPRKRRIKPLVFINCGMSTLD